jgi:hypothetical protein
MKITVSSNGFNEWMRRFVDDPERFEHEWQTVHRFCKEKKKGKEPTYGENSCRYLAQIEKELKNKG